MDSSERTPTAEFSYYTTPSQTPIYTTTRDGATSTHAPDSITLDTDSSAIQLELVAPPPGAYYGIDDTTASDLPPDDSPTALLTDDRSDIFIDISEGGIKERPAEFPQTDDGFDLDVGFPNFGLDLNLDTIGFQYNPFGAEPSSMDTNTMRARKTESFDFVLEIDNEEVREETTVMEEETESILDRMPYFQKFMEAMVEFGAVKRLNNYLHRKMADYFKKRKMDHVLEEVNHPEEAMIKYGKKLDSFAALRSVAVVQKRELTAEMTILRELREKQCTQADTVFQNLLDREAAIGIGLILAKTGKELSEKTVDTLISAQVTKAQELRDLRILHITIRNAVTEKNNQIKKMDRIGENYTLIEFEQLKVENQSNIDKIEDRDDELMRLRRRCQNSIQSLAHIREKCSDSEKNIKLLKEQLQERENAKTAVRERVNHLKQERDFYRLETQRLKDDNGLLTKDKLLLDMETSIQSIENLEQVNNNKRNHLHKGKDLLYNLRSHYEEELRRRLNMGRYTKHMVVAQSSVHVHKKRRRTKRENKYLGVHPSFIRPNIHCRSKFLGLD